MNYRHPYHNDFHRSEPAVSPAEGFRPPEMNGVMVSWFKHGTVGAKMYGKRVAKQRLFVRVRTCRGSRRR